jgi:hypothetical protein
MSKENKSGPPPEGAYLPKKLYREPTDEKLLTIAENAFWEVVQKSPFTPEEILKQVNTFARQYLSREDPESSDSDHSDSTS